MIALNQLLLKTSLATDPSSALDSNPARNGFCSTYDRRLKSDRHLERERTCTYADRDARLRPFAAKGEWGKEWRVVLDPQKPLPEEEQ